MDKITPPLKIHQVLELDIIDDHSELGSFYTTEKVLQGEYFVTGERFTHTGKQKVVIDRFEGDTVYVHPYLSLEEKLNSLRLFKKDLSRLQEKEANHLADSQLELAVHSRIILESLESYENSPDPKLGKRFEKEYNEIRRAIESHLNHYQKAVALLEAAKEQVVFRKMTERTEAQKEAVAILLIERERELKRNWIAQGKVVNPKEILRLKNYASTKYGRRFEDHISERKHNFYATEFHNILLGISEFVEILHDEKNFVLVLGKQFTPNYSPALKVLGNPFYACPLTIYAAEKHFQKMQRQILFLDDTPGQFGRCEFFGHAQSLGYKPIELVFRDGSKEMYQKKLDPEFVMIE